MDYPITTHVNIVLAIEIDNLGFTAGEHEHDLTSEERKYTVLGAVDGTAMLRNTR